MDACAESICIFIHNLSATAVDCVQGRRDANDLSSQFVQPLRIAFMHWKKQKCSLEQNGGNWIKMQGRRSRMVQPMKPMQTKINFSDLVVGLMTLGG